MFLKLFLLATLFIGLGFAGIAIKIWVKKDGEFSGTCASQNPFLNKEGEPCSFCGAAPEEKCKNPEGSKNLSTSIFISYALKKVLFLKNEFFHIKKFLK